MKTLIRVTLSILISIALYFFLREKEIFATIFPYLNTLFRNFILYMTLPLCFFTVAISVCRLQREKKLLRIILKGALFLPVMFVMSYLGILFSLFASNLRLPIRGEESYLIEEVISPLAYTLNLFPENIFSIFTETGFPILPLYLLSFLLGILFSYDREIAEPAYNLFDSLSRIFFMIHKKILVALGILVIPAIVLFLEEWSNILEMQSVSAYIQFSLTLLGATFLLIAGLFPLAAYLLLKKRVHPYRLLSHGLGPVLGGAFLGNIYAIIPILNVRLNKFPGVKRDIASPLTFFYGMFFKGGTAFTLSFSFVIILNSFTSLDLVASQLLWGGFFSVVFSLFTFHSPGTTILVALHLLFNLYQKTLEEAYYILTPLLVPITFVALLLDGTLIFLQTIITADNEDIAEELTPYIKPH